MRTLVLIAGIFLVAGCHVASTFQPGDDDMLRSKPMQVPGREVIWEWVVDEIRNSDFELDPDRSSQVDGTFESRWFVLPSPQRFEGVRKKVVGRIDQDENNPTVHTLLLAVWVQRNADIKDPLEPVRGIWEEDTMDTGMAELFIFRVEQRYGE